MRHLISAAVLLCAVSGSASQVQSSRDSWGPVGQAASVAVPDKAKTQGVPPIPASLAAELAPYASSRRAVLLGWHPARRQVLIQTTFGTVPQIHSVAGPGMDRTQLTFFSDAVQNIEASYEPEGAYFVYRRDAAQGAELYQFFRFDPATAKSVLITDGKSRNGSPVWSHHAGLIAFESTKRNGTDRDLYVMNPMDPSSLRMVSQVQEKWSVVAWSPDDRELIAMQSPSAADTRLWRVDVKTGEKTALTPGDTATWYSAEYAPDGRTVYARTNRASELPRVWRGDLATGTWKPLTKEGDAVEQFALSPDGRTLAVVFNRDAASQLELFDAATMALKAKPAMPTGQILGALQWHPSGSDLAFTLWSIRTFGDVFAVNAKTWALERWTRSELGGFNPDALPDPEIIRWKSFDGRMISGVLYRPPARFTGRRPVIMNIHGGPNDTVERPRYQGRSAYFLNELGIAIVFPNVRGSDGFGKTFQELDNGLHREDAVKDIGALLDWIAAQPFLDKDRVMVAGPSYGGYMAYAVAETYGDRIRCAYAASAISNFISYFETTEPSRLQDRRAEYGDERDQEMRAFLTRISPVTQASKLRVPLLIMHGGNDSRVPIGQAEEMFRAASANGGPVWMVSYADEGHIMPSNQVNNNFQFYVWITFAQKYLLN